MKNKVYFLAIALLCLFIAPKVAFAQTFEVPLDYKIEKSTLVVEGKVVETKCFRAADGYIYTANKVELASILKGNLTGEYLNVVTWGGELDTETQMWTHMLSLKTGEFGVFFLEPTSIPGVPDEHGIQSFDVYSGEQGFLAFEQNQAKAWITKEPFHVYNDINTELFDYIEDKVGQKRIAKGDAESVHRTGIRYRFTDIGFDGTNVTFSVYANSLIGTKTLYRSGIQLGYNPTFFGSNIATNGNLQMQDAGISLSTSYDLTQSDVSSSKVKIELIPVGSPTGFVNLGTNEQLLAKGKITIQNILAGPGIIYNVAEMQSMSRYYSGGSSYVFDTVVVEGDWRLEGIVCPVIDSISPKSVAAGVNGLALNGVKGKITIFGSNFGNPVPGHVKPHLSDVMFFDVDLGYFAAGELEYISWSNNKIEVEVPTMRKQGGTLSAGACTGKVGVFTTDFITGDTCTSFSADKLFVHFGMFNYPWKKDINNWQISMGNFANVTIFGGQRQNLVDVNGMGGYTLDIKPLYPADTTKNKGAVEQTIKALDVYRCGYKINVKVGTTMPNALVRRYPLPTGTAGTTMMQGNSSPLNCDDFSDIDAGVKGFEVRINQQVLDVLNIPGFGTYKFNISDTIPSDTGAIYYTDFQRTMIHELGHVFQLRHTNNVGDMMAPGSITLPSFNNFNRTLSPNDILGVQHLYLLGKVGACGDPGMTDFVCSTGTDYYQDLSVNALVFPNPTASKIYVQASIDGKSCKIEVFSTEGRLIFNEIKDIKNEIIEVQLPPNTPNGLFWIKISDEKGNRLVFNKFIINK